MTTRLPILRAIGVIALVLAALAFAACGGDDGDELSNDEYRKQAQRISDEFEPEFQASLKQATSDNPQESLAGINQISQSSKETAEKLDKLNPPDDYKDVHDKLVGALRTLADRGAQVEQAAESQDRAAVEATVTSFQQAIRDLDRAGKEFDKTVGTT